VLPYKASKLFPSSSYLSNPHPPIHLNVQRTLVGDMSRQSRSLLAAGPAVIAPIFHAAASKRLAKARTKTASSSASSSMSLRPHGWPAEDTVFVVVGEKFEVDFEHVYLNSKKLVAARLGYKVRHKSMFKGQRDPSPIWRYGVELEYLEDNMATVRLWLCKKCHLNREVNDAKAICGNRHIVDHMKAVHRIDPFTGLMPETPSTPRFSTPFEAAKAAGSGTVISHSPWQEEALQSAVIDWLIVKDVSFRNASSSEF
jgi:hypothetical protein